MQAYLWLEYSQEINEQQRVVQPLISPRLCTTDSSAGAKQ